MIVLIVIGWVVVLPLCVVLGLFCAAKVLGHRAHASRANGTTGVTDMTAFARQFTTVRDSASEAPVGVRSQATGRTVGAGY